MRQFMMTVMALAAFGAMVVTAQAQGGAPIRNGDQCFKYTQQGSGPSDANMEAKDGRFGSWRACPQPTRTRAGGKIPSPGTKASLVRFIHSMQGDSQIMMK
jgi:hypothetical protein